MNNVKEVVDAKSSHFMSLVGQFHKRERKPENWKRNIQKRSRAVGIQYINSKNQLVPERKIGKDCLCRKQCFSKFTNEEKIFIFKSFYQLADKEKQDTYLRGLITREPIKRKRPRTGRRHERSTSFSYILRVQDKTVEVCKQAIVSIHGITRSRLDRILALSLVYITGPPDLRGHHNNRPRKIDNEILMQMYNHISSFIRQPESQKKIKTCFINNVTPRALYYFYIERYDNKENPIIKYSYFYRYLQKKFNYRGGRCGRPKTKVKNTEDEELLDVRSEEPYDSTGDNNEKKDTDRYQIVKVTVENLNDLCVAETMIEDDFQTETGAHLSNTDFPDKLKMAIYDKDLSRERFITVIEEIEIE